MAERKEMTREERFKMDMIDEFKQMCKIVEKDGRIITNKQRMLKALEQKPTNPCDLCIFDSMDGDNKYCGECPATAKGG